MSERHLGDLRNLGPASERLLADAGIRTEERLRRLGAVEAFCRVVLAGHRPGTNLLWALEGALTDRPWTEIDDETRERLKAEVREALPASRAPKDW
jgi:DNA transformation protein